LLLAGEQLEAPEAAAIGLITRSVPPDGITATIDDLVAKLTSLSGIALRLNKRALRMGRRNWAEPLPEVERLYLTELMQTEDAREGVEAFMAKREPVWRHR
jgi:cyclohexa-1,5-dienecarbonyl-CoA hydratase